MSKKIKRTELDSYEVYILGLTILGENTEDEEEIDEDYFYDAFVSAGIEIDFYSFKEIVCRLFPLIDVAKSPLTKKIYKGFSKDKEGFKEWLIKEEM
jgi:hypothetical protein